MTTDRLLLIRHGESEANAAATAAEAEGLEVIPIRMRDASVPLSPLGQRQAAALGPRLSAELGSEPATAARVWSSPYLRAVQTAALALGDTAVFPRDERLRDRELGVLDLLTTAGVDARLPLEAERRRWHGKFYYRPPGGEAWTDVALRIRSFVRDVDWADERPVVIFSHDAVVSLFLYVLLGFDEQQLNEFLLTRTVGNASVTTLISDADGRWSVESFSDDSHLTAAGIRPTEHPGATRVDPL
jgi:broad specificity phosphatase PhoE